MGNAIMFNTNNDKNKNADTKDPLTDVFRPSKGAAKLHVGNGVNIKGEISNADDVQIDGHADVNLKTNNLIIGGTGELNGNIACNNCDVWGKVEGEIKVDGTLTVQEQGSVTGNIEYQDLQIKLGGKIIGDIKSLDKIKNISDTKLKPLQEVENKLDKSPKG